MQGLIRWTGAAAKLLIIATGLVIALPVVPASALGTISPTLSVTTLPERVNEQGNRFARVHVPTVEGFVTDAPSDLTGYQIAIRLWGDDLVSDDLRKGPIYIAPKPNDPRYQCPASGAAYFYKYGPSIKFHWCVHLLPGFGDLNEDLGLDDRDEIYAGVRLLAPGGATVRSAETNRVYGKF